jgi:NAD(P)-dependent dehydrogenase (short-subunit alcohol dehydrogenase family)
LPRPTACGGLSDLSKPTDATGLIEHAARELGRVDVLVYNAGIQRVAPVHEFPVERWDAVIVINLTAVFLTTRAVLPQMLASLAVQQFGGAEIIRVRGALAHELFVDSCLRFGAVTLSNAARPRLYRAQPPQA